MIHSLVGKIIEAADEDFIKCLVVGVPMKHSYDKETGIYKVKTKYPVIVDGDRITIGATAKQLEEEGFIKQYG